MIQEKRIVDHFASLVAIDAPSRGERALAETVKGQLRALGLSIEEDQAGAAIGGDCNNIYATWPGTLDWPPLIFCAHFDTVEPGQGKRAVIGSDGIITSAGDTVLGADDLSGLTAIVEAIRSIGEDGLEHRTVELFLTVAEEQHLLGSTHAELQRLKGRQAYVLDASGSPGTAIVQAPGNIGLVFELQGQSAHAGMEPEKGVSAITAAAKGIAAMRLGRIDTETTANIGRICGGGATNIVADACTVTAECRSRDWAKLEAQANQMCASMENAARELGARVSIQRHVSYRPYAVPADSPVLARFQAVCQKLKLAGDLQPGGGGSDNNTLCEAGFDGIVLTCGMDQVHSCQERIAVRDLVDTARLVESLIKEP